MFKESIDEAYYERDSVQLWVKTLSRDSVLWYIIQYQILYLFNHAIVGLPVLYTMYAYTVLDEIADVIEDHALGQCSWTPIMQLQTEYSLVYRLLKDV